jgi:hypothetical protein
LLLILLGIYMAWPQRDAHHFDAPFSGFLDRYGELAARITPVGILQEAPVWADASEMSRWQSERWRYVTWRDLNGTVPEGADMLVVTPDAADYHTLISRCISHHIRILVECSGMDGWHTSVQGQRDLEAMRGKVLRVVIFDGGHHLPTLALRPDLVIIPVTWGYAAHGYMKDAVSVKTVTDIIRREKINCPVITVPRWSLVKTPASLSRIAMRALTALPAGGRPQHAGSALAPRATRYHNAIFIYAENENIGSIPRLVEDTAARDTRVYLACDYGSLSPGQWQACYNGLKQAGIRVRIVNQPLDVTGVLLRGGAACIKERLPLF